jgi:hypothetical protein
MSKLDIGVGDEFPLDESRPQDDRHAGRGRRRHHHGHHHHEYHYGHHHGRHRRHRPGGLAMLLVIAGLIALIVEHKLTAEMAYAMIGLGAVLLLATFALHALWHRRHHRGMHMPPSQAV